MAQTKREREREREKILLTDSYTQEKPGSKFCSLLGTALQKSLLDKN